VKPISAIFYEESSQRYLSLLGHISIFLLVSCRQQGVLLQADKCFAAQKGVSHSLWPKGPQGPQGCRGGIRKEDPSGSERGSKEDFSPRI